MRHCYTIIYTHQGIAAYYGTQIEADNSNDALLLFQKDKGNFVTPVALAQDNMEFYRVSSKSMFCVTNVGWQPNANDFKQ